MPAVSPPGALGARPQHRGETKAAVTVADKVASGAFWGTTSRVVMLVTQLVSTPVLARLLSRRDFGIVNMSATFFFVAAILSEFGIGNYLLKARPLTERERQAGKLSAWLLGIASSTAGVVAAVPLARFYGEPALAPVVAAQSLVMLLSNAAIVHTITRMRALDFRRLAMVAIAGNLTYCLVALALAWAGSGYWSIVSGRAAQAAVSLAVVTPTLTEIFPRRASWSDVRPILAFGAAVSVIGAMAQLCENVDNMSVGRLLGTASLGLYAVSYNAATLPQKYLAFMVGGIAIPLVAQAQDGEPLARALCRLARYQILFPVAVAAALGVFAPEACLVLLGGRWPDAPDLVRIMAVSAAMLSLQTVVQDALLNRGLLRPLRAYHAFKLLATTVLVLAGARFGVAGVAIGFAMAASLSVIAGLAYLGARLDLGAGRILGAMVRPLGVVLLSTAVGVGAREGLSALGLSKVPLLVTGTLVFLAMAVGLVRLLCPGEWQEVRAGLISLARRARQRLHAHGRAAEVLSSK